MSDGIQSTNDILKLFSTLATTTSPYQGTAVEGYSETLQFSTARLDTKLVGGCPPLTPMRTNPIGMQVFWFEVNLSNVYNNQVNIRISY